MDNSIENLRPVDFVGLGDFVELGANYLIVSPDADDQILANIGTKLKTLEGSINWYVGDYINQVGRLRGSDRVDVLLETWGKTERTAYDARRICEEFKPEERNPALHYSHYKVLEEECDDHEEMLRFADQASSETLTISGLRLAIRKSKQGRIDRGTVQRTLDFNAIQGSIKFATVHPPEELSPTDREILKQSAAKMVEWWRKIAEA